jgi:ornithine cyclodeaminase/alanine dehydrogenase-like protein (mu-crystallin family)
VTLIISRSDVERIVEADERAVLRAMIDRIAAGYAETARGVVREHSRIYLRYPDDGARRPPGLFSMSALLPGARVMGTRLLALGGGVHSQGILVLFSHGENRCLAIVDDSTLHMYRSGAPQGLATRLLARPGSRVVGCFGSSGMARGGLAMVQQVLPHLERVKVYSPTPAHRERFASEMQAWMGVEVTPVGVPEDAAEADVIITATDADRPVVGDAAIRPGTHINLMARNEIELATLRRSTVVSASNQALRELDPPLREPIPEDLIACEMASLVSGAARGRTSSEEITTFIGVTPLAMWDVAAAAVIYEAAQRLGIGTDVDIAG